jgi:hypothetical protein
MFSLSLALYEMEQPKMLPKRLIDGKEVLRLVAI